MIQTSIGTLQVGSPWLSRQWVNSIPGIQVTTGITQNNLTIRAGHRRPSVNTDQSMRSPSQGTADTGSGSTVSAAGPSDGGLWFTYI